MIIEEVSLVHIEGKLSPSETFDPIKVEIRESALGKIIYITRNE